MQNNIKGLEHVNETDNHKRLTKMEETNFMRGLWGKEY